MPTSETGSTSTGPGTAKSSARADAPAAALELDGLTFAFGAGPPAVEGLTLSAERGSLFALLGPSGCGKTTLLRLLGGYLAPHAGTIRLGGEDVTAWPPERRHVGMVFQSYALFPHLSAFDNVAFGLAMRGVSRRERARRVEEMLARVGLSAAEGQRQPAALSGGQQQRVALARALVTEPRLLLLDEPMANLDRQLRHRLRAQVKELQRQTAVTTLLVTHDQEEALALADRVGIMLAGRLLQVDAPQQLYRRPRCPFVARFLGDANLLEVEAVDGETVRLRGGPSLPRPADSGLAPIRPGSLLLVRPEQCRLGPGAECPHPWPGRVVDRTFHGADQVLTVALTDQLSLRVRCGADEALAFPPGAAVAVGVPATGPWVIPEDDPEWVRSLPSEALP